MQPAVEVTAKALPLPIVFSLLYNPSVKIINNKATADLEAYGAVHEKP